jgi:hypothetical protein
MIKKTEILVVPVSETPAEVLSNVNTNPKSSKTLEEKVLDYINNHPCGVQILDMEILLGEKRMKIGFVTKNLFNEGKVQKRENLYYPLKTA